ncbi:hypothetical protein [Brevifollis gellanilyticus]|uniref:Uncharacterized protein n=1 Tax=Brevifollis gellanilyticus TaxID=748831 RepID=A0A512MHI4_9BACT|nr:hypothetical protein [Brevifollis gellanilyticus]GEP46192.1 hypothetical protein BGE01nite_54830 [Brevifollis gellanilyticus]
MKRHHLIAFGLLFAAGLGLWVWNAWTAISWTGTIQKDVQVRVVRQPGEMPVPGARVLFLSREMLGLFKTWDGAEREAWMADSAHADRVRLTNDAGVSAFKASFAGGGYKSLFKSSSSYHVEGHVVVMNGREIEAELGLWDVLFEQRLNSPVVLPEMKVVLTKERTERGL